MVFRSTDIAKSARRLAVGLTLALSAAGAAAASTFSYSYANPYDAAAQTYIHSTSNIALYSEGSVRVWKPVTGGTTLANTTPGIVTYKFDFGTDIVDSATLFTSNPSFHWSYSQGHTFFYGSKDGTTWEQLVEAPPPAYGSANGGVYNGLLPTSLLGGTQLWFKAELYSYGTSAPQGGVLTNTAQHSRHDVNSNNTSFSLDVDFRQGPALNAVPLPAGFPLMGAGLIAFGCIARRKRHSA